MSRTRWVTLCILALAGISHQAAAQPEISSASVRLLSNTVSVRRWGNEQGLPQASVIRLAVDRDGYVWGATFGGLIRFDGRSIVSRSARELPVLTGNAVTALLVRPNGEIMLGTPSGTIARLRDGRIVDTLPRAPMPSGGGVTDLLDDADGTLWAESRGVIYQYADGRWAKAPVPYRLLSPLTHDSLGRVLFHGPQGVIRLHRDRAEVLAPPVTASPGGMHSDRRGRIWLGGTDGLHLFEGGQPRRVPGVPGPVLEITSDQTGTLWLGIGHVLYRYRPDDEGVSGARAIPAVDAGDNITALEPTADGALVVGTLNGLLVVRQASVNVIESPAGPPYRDAASLLGDGTGRIWVTADCSATRLLDRTGAVRDSITMPGSSTCSRSLARDARGRLWVGGDGAIKRRAPDGTERQWTIPSTRATAAVVRPLLLLGDTLIFGLSDGRIGRIGPSDTITFPAPWHLPDDRPIESFARSQDGTIWVAQTGRLTRWRGMRREVFGTDVGIPNAVPRALLPHSSGGVWIGTYGSGLVYFRAGARARPVPLPDQTVSALLDDGEGRLWMPGNRGITAVVTSSLERWLRDSTEVPMARLLSSSAGVPEGNFGMPAAAVIAPRVLAFASVAGLVVVHPGSVADQGATPPLRIDAIRTPRRTFMTNADMLEVAPEDRLLFVEFSAPSFRYADETEFRYRLDGRDDDWIALGQNRDLRLVGLRPGRFVLRIEARVPDGEWRAADPLSLVVRPLFVERLWWRFALGGLLLVMVALYYRQRLKAVHAEARAREVAMRARQQAAELQEQHQREVAQVSRVAVAGELTASLSHELGQPLAAIVNNAEVARRLLARSTPAAVDPRVGEALADVVAEGQRASEVVRAFRRFLRREQGEREVLGVRELLDSTMLLLGREYADAGVALTLTVDEAVPLVHGERVLLQQVFVNLLQNALWAAEGERVGQVLVRARRASGGVRITVVDNGPGFSRELRARVFDPFVTSKQGGLGMGLPIARRVVEAHAGHIGVSRLRGAGAVVSVWLPAAHPALTSEAPASSLQRSRLGFLPTAHG